MRRAVFAMILLAACGKTSASPSPADAGKPEAVSPKDAAAANALLAMRSTSLSCANVPAINPVSAVIAQQRLWVAASDGDLYSFDLQLGDVRRARRRQENAAFTAVARGKGDALLALEWLPTEGGYEELESRTNKAWIHRLAANAAPTELAFSLPPRLRPFHPRPTERLIEVGDHIVIVGPGTMTILDATGAVVPGRLRREMLRGQLSVVAGRFDDFFVGINDGEFGGAVVRVHFDADPEVILGSEFWRDSNLTPVTDVALGAEGCIYAASGLTHLGLQDGRVHQICHGRRRTLFERRIPSKYPAASDPIRKIAVRDNAFLAIGDEAIYRVTDTEQREIDKSAVRRVCGLSVIPVEGFWLFATGLAVAKP